MKRVLCLLMILALCLPVLAAAEGLTVVPASEVEMPEGTWYYVILMGKQVVPLAKEPSSAAELIGIGVISPLQFPVMRRLDKDTILAYDVGLEAVALIARSKRGWVYCGPGGLTAVRHDNDAIQPVKMAGYVDYDPRTDRSTIVYRMEPVDTAWYERAEVVVYNDKVMEYMPYGAEDRFWDGDTSWFSNLLIHESFEYEAF